uniref:RICIN domain-containing protein n=1 Tax=Pseudanabaena sp. UWO311 TaxID=2487337 RepID=UPI00115C3D70
FVKIKNRNWGKCLNLQSNATQNGGLPNVWDCVSHPDQEWKIEAVEGSVSSQQVEGSVSPQQVDSMKSNFEAFATHYFAQGNRGTATVERFDFDGTNLNYRVKLRHYHVTKNFLYSATVYDVTSYVEGSFKPSDIMANRAYPNICVDLPRIVGGDKICQQYKF